MKNYIHLFTLCVFLICCSSKKNKTNKHQNNNDKIGVPKKKGSRIIDQQEALTLIETFYKSLNNPKCKALSFWLSKDQLNNLITFKSSKVFGKNNGIRFYFGEYPMNYSDSFLRGTITLLATVTEKSDTKTDDSAAIYYDVNNNEMLNLGGNSICPGECSGVLLYPETITNDIAESCHAIFDSGISNTQLNTSWGDLTQAQATALIQTYYYRNGLIDNCKTLAVNFTNKAIISLDMLVKKLNDPNKEIINYASGIRVYLMSYMGSWPGIPARHKNSIVLTLTEQVSKKGNVFHQDILKVNDPAQYAPLNNGSRCPPGLEASLVDTLARRGIISKECFKNYEFYKKLTF